jgi:hypothetical protein
VSLKMEPSRQFLKFFKLFHFLAPAVRSSVMWYLNFFDLLEALDPCRMDYAGDKCFF